MNRLQKHSRHCSGFTLLEVLVATVILFSAMATVALIYRGALLSSERANEHVISATVIPVILSQIQNDIRNLSNTEETELSGQGRAWNVSYQWAATLSAFKAPQPIFDIDTGQLAQQPTKYKLWSVQLTTNADGLIREYSYQELGWNAE